MSKEQWGDGYHKGYADAMEGVCNVSTYRYCLLLLLDICDLCFDGLHMNYKALYSLSKIPDNVIDKCLRRYEKDNRFSFVLVDREIDTIILNRRIDCIRKWIKEEMESDHE